MRKILKWLIGLFIVFVVLVVALLLLKDVLIKSIAESQIRAQTGMDVKIGKLEVALSSPTITMESFKLYNTSEFGGSTFVDLPELHVEYDRDALLARKIHLKLVRFNLAEMNIVKNQNGQTNVVELLAKVQQKEDTKAAKTTKPVVEFTGVDTLNITLGKVKLTDLKDPAKNKQFDIGLKNEVVRSVTSQADLLNVVFKVLYKNGVPLLGDVVSKGTELLKDPSKTIEKGAKKLLDGLTSPLKK